MTDLFNSPVLRIGQLPSQLEYDISDGDGRLICKATQVAGPQPRRGLKALLGSGVHNARCVVQVGMPGGPPLFYVDHQGGAPTAIVAPDGTVLGRLVHDLAGTAFQGPTAVQVLTGGAAASSTVAYRLVDAQDRPVCQLDFHLELRGMGNDSGGKWILVGCTIADMNDQKIAEMDIKPGMFKDRYTLHLLYQLSEPLRTLVIASPLAFDLSQS